MSDFGETTFPIGRKNHQCHWCAEIIPKGEKHAHFVGKWENEFQNWRMHSECYEDADDCDLSLGFMFGEHERPRRAEAKLAANAERAVSTAASAAKTDV